MSELGPEGPDPQDVGVGSEQTSTFEEASAPTESEKGNVWQHAHNWFARKEPEARERRAAAYTKLTEQKPGVPPGQKFQEKLRDFLSWNLSIGAHRRLQVGERITGAMARLTKNSPFALKW